MFNKQPSTESKRLYTLEVDGLSCHKKSEYNLKSSKDLYNEALRQPLKQLKASKILCENRNSYSKIKPATKRGHNLLLQDTMNNPTATSSTIVFHERKTSRSKNNGKNSSEYIFTDRNNQENVFRSSFNKHEKSLSLKKLKSEGTPLSQNSAVRLGQIANQARSVTEEEYQKLVQELTEQNRSLKKSLANKNQNYVTMKVEDVLSLINMFAVQKAKYKQVKEELDFLKAQNAGLGNSVFKVLSPDQDD